MRILFVLALVAGSVWTFARYAPEPWREAALGRTGLGRIFGETLPGWVRAKLTIPPSAEERRKALLDDLARELVTAGGKLEALADEDVKNLTMVEVRREAAAAKEAVRKTESLLNKVAEEGTREGVVSRSVSRILDAILPAPGSPPEATSTPACEPR